MMLYFFKSIEKREKKKSCSRLLGVCCLLIVTTVSCFVEVTFKVYNVLFSSWLLVLNS